MLAVIHQLKSSAAMLHGDLRQLRNAAQSPMDKPNSPDTNSGDGKTLNEVATTGPHTWPKRHIADMWFVQLRQDESRDGFLDPCWISDWASGEEIAKFHAEARGLRDRGASH